MKTIITHIPPHHLDEVVAVSLLLTKFPDAKVKKVKTVNLEEVDNETVVVDVGGRYKPPHLLDHHADKELPASFVLVLKHFFGINMEPAIAFEDYWYLSDKDTMGPSSVSHLSKVQHPAERWIVSLFEKVDQYRAVFIEIGKQILAEIEKRIQDIILLKKFPPDEEGVANLTEVEKPNLTLYSKLFPARAVITKNPRGGYSITRLSGVDPWKFDPEEYAKTKEWQIIFRHPGGFMVVVKDI